MKTERFRTTCTVQHCVMNFSFLNFRQDKYMTSVVEGEPSYYNNNMKLQILNVTADDFGLYLHSFAATL